MSKGRIASLLTTATLLAVVVAAVFNVQRIQDTVLYHQYEPSAAVASFASDTGMSDYGKFLFYASQPLLQEAQAFNEQCKKNEQSTAILGCYDGQRIYIYDITNPRLAGIRPTTAAHEMLHAAYKRLSDKDRQSVNALLETEYNKLKGDQELADRIAFYDRTQPGERDNELHSIIGTEISGISPELEAYYGRYFSDRSKVIAQHQQYRSVFEELRTRSDALSQRIDQLGEDIKKQSAAYNAQSSEVQGAISSFNARAQRGDFESQVAFTRERQALLARAAALDNLRTEINSAITEYNTLVAELNSIALETDTLNRSMDSQLAPAPSL